MSSVCLDCNFLQNGVSFKSEVEQTQLCSNNKLKIYAPIIFFKFISALLLLFFEMCFEFGREKTKTSLHRTYTYFDAYVSPKSQCCTRTVHNIKLTTIAVTIDRVHTHTRHLILLLLYVHRRDTTVLLFSILFRFDCVSHSSPSTVE